MEPRYEALFDLLKNEEDAIHLMSLSVEEAKEYLHEKHRLDFTITELNDIADGMKSALVDDSQQDELSEAMLENVSGGKNSVAYNVGYYIGKGVKIVGTGIKIIGGILAGNW